MKIPEKLNPIIKYIIVIASIIYVATLIKLLFFRFYMYSNSVYLYNLVPFKTITTYIRDYHHYNFRTWFDNLFGNILLMIPLGFIVPYFFKKLKNTTKIILTIVFIISILEITQFGLHLGSFDIDDIILNTLGGITGIFIFRIIKKTGVLD